MTSFTKLGTINYSVMDESQADDVGCSSQTIPPATKRAKRASKWKEEWKQYNMQPSKRGPTYAFCKICSSNFSVASGGIHEVKRHITSKRQTDLSQQSSGQLKITYFMFKKDGLADQVMASVIYFATFVAEHNIPFLAADHFTKLCKSMFPDSKIAQKFACSRTKTTAIIKKALSPIFSDEVVQTCHTSRFTLLCDGGNDQSHQKYFGIMVRYWNKKLKQPVTRFLSMPICNIATAELLFLAIEKEFELHGIPWNNLIGYASDTASVMVGKYNSVFSRLLDK